MPAPSVNTMRTKIRTVVPSLPMMALAFNVLQVSISKAIAASKLRGQAVWRERDSNVKTVQWVMKILGENVLRKYHTANNTI